jgi:hypothetical protein
MVSGSAGLCDICGEEIPKGDTYVTYQLPSEAAALIQSAHGSDSDVPPIVEQDGTVRWDVCLNCRMNMGFPGKESVN